MSLKRKVFLKENKGEDTGFSEGMYQLTHGSLFWSHSEIHHRCLQLLELLHAQIPQQ